MGIRGASLPIPTHFDDDLKQLPVYSSTSSVLSEELILLVRLRDLTLELCRLLNIDDREKALI